MLDDRNGYGGQIGLVKTCVGGVKSVSVTPERSMGSETLGCSKIA